MIRSLHVFAYFVLLLLVVVLSYLVNLAWPPRVGELPNKREWSVLQIAESRHRDKGMTGAVTEKNYADSGFDLIGVLDSDNTTHWILGNAEGIPRVKMIPPFSPFRISQREYDQITTSIQLNEEVRTLLENSIENPPK